jgi:hypothetical protein
VTDEEKRKVANALERRKKEATIVENVQTALRALIQEPSDLRELIKLHSKVGTSMKLPNLSAMEVAQGAVCDAMVEQRICGQHVPMLELRNGAKVRITPISADVADKIGSIKAKLPSESLGFTPLLRIPLVLSRECSGLDLACVSSAAL